MQIPEWVKPAATGAAGGAVALAIVGFGFAGWVTGGTAQEMSSKAADEASVKVIAAICINQFAAGPNAKVELARLKEAKAWERDDFIEAGGWSTVAGVENGTRKVADECARQLAAMDELPVMMPKVPTADNG
ncbi:hypothetical protein [Oricola thermophila]|uniref:Uncharacterized protein n=1 Tax=Oricola thermophila TaxID=2742145 RepID=A0A6N1VDL2_9HYPH|nr:hypothetical protein [Oricola thermophila]QKV17127.1 hypothetical protein HTY61_00930 [Oricola thermophila]